MATPATPSASKPTGDAQNPNPVPATGADAHFGDHLRVFWERNSRTVTFVLAVVMLAIVARGGWEYLQAQREQEIEHAYEAATTPAQLRSFASEHSHHPLAGAAWLRIGDEAYAANRFSDAIAPYEEAAAILKEGPLASRARLGAAISKLQSGRSAEGEAALKAFAADPKETNSFRAEAAYHLAANAFVNNRPDDVKTYSDMILQIEPESPWAQRAMALRAQASPSPAAPASGQPAQPGITLPVPGK